MSFGQEVEQELPLVLVMGVRGPLEVGDAPREGELGAYAVARALLARGLGEWWALRALSRTELDSWIGPSSLELRSTMWAITEGNPGEVPDLWDGWVKRGVIQEDEEGCWRIVGGVERTFAEAGDSLNAQLMARLGPDNLRLIEDVRELLACAALEGHTFTAEAIARALSWDPNALIDLLDDCLTAESGPLAEATSVVIPQVGGESRTLWRYRFARNLDRRIALVRFASGAERQRLAQRLAPALIVTYSPEPERIAVVLVALFELIGDPSAADYFRRVATYGVVHAVARAQAHYVMSAETEAWSEPELVIGAELLVHAADVLFGTDSYPDTLEFAYAAAGLAARARHRLLQARAIHQHGRSLTYIGELEDARRDFRRAADLLGEMSPRFFEGQIAAALGQVELRLGDFDAARIATERALEISQQIGDPSAEAGCWKQLGMIDARSGRGRYDAARSAIERALELYRKNDDRYGEADSWHELGLIELTHGDPEAARLATERSLRIFQEIGKRDAEAINWHQLGLIELVLGHADAARTPTETALKISQEIGSRDGEASSYSSLGQIDLALGNVETARMSIEHALEIFQDIGSRDREAESQLLLGRAHFTLGRFEAGREETKRALALYQEIRKRDGEAASWLQLGGIERALDNTDSARAAAQKALGISREMGSRDREAASNELLDELDA